MLEALLEFITSPPGIVGVICVLLLLIFAWDRNYRLARPISDNITKIGEPNTDKLIRAILALGVAGVCLYVILSQNYSDDVEKWAMSLIGSIVGAYGLSKR